MNHSDKAWFKVLLLPPNREFSLRRLLFSEVLLGTGGLLIILGVSPLGFTIGIALVSSGAVNLVLLVLCLIQERHDEECIRQEILGLNYS